ncbi:hypothetical protein, partial [Pseudomonas syringae group genomosp. 7]|uniref:hypothetical protein n=1 Tax=Pseudomonas syringae group genomosp. 7 TaxID=251699 RepID=UPI00376FE629
TLVRGNAARDALRRNEDAERPELHVTKSGARLWCCDYRSARSSVGMQFTTLFVEKRTRSVPNGTRRRALFYFVFGIIVTYARVCYC